MTDHDLGRTLEAASLRAWPALEEEDLEGWKLRASEGFTGRANSVQALEGSTVPVQERVARCERWYAERGLSTLFRLTPFSEPGLDDALAARGYPRVNRTLVLHRAAAGLLPRLADTELRDNGLHDWLSRYAGFTGGPAASAPLQRIIERSAGRSFPAVLWSTRPRRAVACGLAVLDRGLLGLFDLVVDPSERGRGYGDELVRRLVAWGCEDAAERVYLQVTEDNAPALALYDKLGFEQAYDYWYRIRPT